MTATTLPRTSGDEREDHATTAGAWARDVLQRAELVMLAGMAAKLPKIASSSVTPPWPSFRPRPDLGHPRRGHAPDPASAGRPFRRRGNRCEPRSCRRRPAPSSAGNREHGHHHERAVRPGRALLLRRRLRRPAAATRERRRAQGVPAGRRAAGYGRGQLPSEHALELHDRARLARAAALRTCPHSFGPTSRQAVQTRVGRLG